MRLLSIELYGQYKGLRDQTFDFSMAQGDVVVLIGANGSPRKPARASTSYWNWIF